MKLSALPLKPGVFSKVSVPAYLRKGNLKSLENMLQNKFLAMYRRGAVSQDLGKALSSQTGKFKNLAQVREGLRKGNPEALELRKLINKIQKNPESHGFLPIPKKLREESFKHWKRTGKLPYVSERGPGGGVELLKGKGTPYTRSDELVDVYHATSPRGIKPALSGRASNFVAEPSRAVEGGAVVGRKRALIPGQMGMHTKGSFWTVHPEEAAYYAKHWPEPRILKAKIPKKYLIQPEGAKSGIEHGLDIPEGERVVPGVFSRFLRDVQTTIPKFPPPPASTTATVKKGPATWGDLLKRTEEAPSFESIRRRIYPPEA